MTAEEPCSCVQDGCSRSSRSSGVTGSRMLTSTIRKAGESFAADGDTLYPVEDGALLEPMNGKRVPQVVQPWPPAAAPVGDARISEK